MTAKNIDIESHLATGTVSYLQSLYNRNFDIILLREFFYDFYNLAIFYFEHLVKK